MVTTTNADCNAKINADEAMVIGLEAGLTDIQYERVHKDPVLRQRLPSVATLKRTRARRFDSVRSAFGITECIEEQTASVMPEKLKSFLITGYGLAPGAELRLKLVVDGTTAGREDNVWFLLQVHTFHCIASPVISQLSSSMQLTLQAGGTWGDTSVFGEVFPVLGFAGKEKDLSANGGETKTQARSFLRKLQEVKTVSIANAETGEEDVYAVRLFLCSDLCATWRLLGGDKMEYECPYCTTADFSQRGAERTDFSGALVDVPASTHGGVTAFIVPCMLHAWLRLANQRIDAIYNRCKRGDRSHSEKTAKALFEKLRLPFWTKTATSDHFVFTTHSDAMRLADPEVDAALAEFEGLTNKAVWARWYELYRGVEKGVQPEDRAAFTERAQEAVNKFVAEYSADQLRIYQHVVAEHACDVQAHLGNVPLGAMANQRAEASHHTHKVAYVRHTMKGGIVLSATKAKATRGSP
jgi:broad specificity phosphatase PhoE